MNYSDLENFGFLKIDMPKDINLKEEIKKLKKEKNAVILGHFYIDEIGRASCRERV